MDNLVNTLKAKVEMDNLVDTLKAKVEKHKEKCEAHLSSESILKAEYEHLKATSTDTARIESVQNKLLSTVKNIEYHQGSYKTYQKVIDMIEDK